MYKILPYTKEKAEKLNVEIKPSKRKGKKIDVYKNNKKIASIGAIGYPDYPTYQEMEQNGIVKKGTANKRRKAYKKRFEKTRKKKGTPSYYADQLLW